MGLIISNTQRRRAVQLVHELELLAEFDDGGDAEDSESAEDSRRLQSESQQCLLLIVLLQKASACLPVCRDPSGFSMIGDRAAAIAGTPKKVQTMGFKPAYVPCQALKSGPLPPMLIKPGQ